MLQDKRIAVIGDFMLDRYIHGHSARLAQEAPIPVVSVEREEYRLGGAGNVAANIKALGGSPVCMTEIGFDRDSYALFGLMAEMDTTGVLRSNEVGTTVKTRVLCGNHIIARMDHDPKVSLPGPARVAALTACLRAALAGVDAVIVADYAKGFINCKFAALWSVLKTSKLPIFIDPKPKNAVEYPTDWEVKCYTPNTSELMAMTGMISFEHFKSEYPTEYLLRTDGDAGMMLDGREGGWRIGADAQAVYDVTGAGDTVIAALALAYANGYDMLEAAKLANRAAGIVVGKLGTSTVTQPELFGWTSPTAKC